LSLGNRSVNLIRKIWNRLNSNECTEVAAQVSFYFVLSLFPFFLVLATLLGWIPTTSRWDFADGITTYFPFQARRLMLTNMIELSYGYGGFLSFGLLATIWSASSGFSSLMEALSTAYGLKDGRRYLKKRTIGFCTTLVAALLLLLSLALWNLGHLIAGLISPDFVVFEMQWRFARWVATFLLMCIGIDLINYFLPAAGRPWKWLTPGTVLVAVALIWATIAFNFCIIHGTNIPRIYRTHAGFIVLTLWIYAANLILLIGAETDTAIHELRSNGASA
jgi:membrane protein